MLSSPRAGCSAGLTQRPAGPVNRSVPAPLGDVDRALIAPVFWSWLFLGVADAIEAMIATNTPTDLRWTTSNLVKRTALMGADAQPWTSS